MALKGLMKTSLGKITWEVYSKEPQEQLSPL